MVPTIGNMDGCEDVIEDDYDSFDELFTQFLTDGNNLEQNYAEQPPRRHIEPRSLLPKPGSKKSTNTSKRFILPSAPHPQSKSSAPLLVNEDSLPWAQRYSPLNLEELGVHKKKVEEVEVWLNHALSGNAFKRLLVLRGPTGSGKTTTLSLLSKKLKFNILEWKTPMVSEYATKDYVPLTAQFDEFLNRSNRFRGLDLHEVVDAEEATEQRAFACHQRVILIEEFPNLSGRSFSSLAAFRLTLQRYISMTPQQILSHSEREASNYRSTPIVIILSETFATPESPISENLTAYRLLGRDICNHLSTTIIDFNSIAPTFMYKALNLALEKDTRSGNHHKSPSTALLKSVSKSGDIRSALATLEFICLDTNSNPSKQLARGNTKSKKPARTRDIVTATDEGNMKSFTQKEANLGLFHAVGKIVYNKRDDPVPDNEHLTLPPPPRHLHHLKRPKVSQVYVNELVDVTGTDRQTFISALHENYVPSCSGAFFTEHLDKCIEALSDSDVLCPDLKGYSRNRSGMGYSTIKSSSGIDLFRQDDISYQVAARGLLFALPSPVKRQTSSSDSSKPKIDPYKIFAPSSLRLLHDMEEMQGLIDSWASILLRLSNSQVTGPTPKVRAVQTQRNADVKEKSNQKDYGHIHAVTITMISRDELILYQLPYMAIFLDKTSHLRELKQITSYSGPEMQCHGSDSCGIENGTLETYPTGRILSPLDSASHRANSTDHEAQSPRNQGEEGKGLVLSDDDIVDD